MSLLNHIKEIINWTYAKYSVILALPISLFIKDFFKPVGGMIVTIGILVLADIVTGLLRAKKNKVKITSKRFWERKPALVVLWLFGLVLMLVVDRQLANEVGEIPLIADLFANHWGAKVWCLYKIFYELFSNLENLHDLGLKEAGFVKKLLKTKMPEELKEEFEENDKKQD